VAIVLGVLLLFVFLSLPFVAPMDLECYWLFSLCLIGNMKLKGMQGYSMIGVHVTVGFHFGSTCSCAYHIQHLVSLDTCSSEAKKLYRAGLCSCSYRSLSLSLNYSCCRFDIGLLRLLGLDITLGEVNSIFQGCFFAGVFPLRFPVRTP
jgi:hypothetical protein